MPVVNNNLKMIDRPVWEQLSSTPAATAAAVALVDDGVRFIYSMFSATSFWRYDTWADTWQQLASPPGGTLAAGSCLRYVTEMGAQLNGEVFGSVYAFMAAGASVTFYRYNIADNTWTAALSVTNIPAAFGTDGRLHCPEPALNAFQGGYHNAQALNVITTTAQANAGATTIAVSALPLALPAGAVLNFGTAAAPIWAVLTAAAAASATSITVSALIATVPTATSAYWYADMFLFGNAGTVVYRYNIASNAWALTSANTGNPAIPAVTGTLGAGHIVAWLPGAYDATLNPQALNRLVVVRGTASAAVYEYDLATNLWSTLTTYPATETFTTGTSSAVRANAQSKMEKLLIQKDATGRIFQLNRKTARWDPIATQNLVGAGTALVGDKMCLLRDPSLAVDFLFTMLSTSTSFLRSPLAF